jgi:hypothetical protein
MWVSMQWLETCILLSNYRVCGSVCSGSKRVYFRVMLYEVCGPICSGSNLLELNLFILCLAVVLEFSQRIMMFKTSEHSG